MSLNWRKPLVSGMLNLLRSPILRELTFIRSLDKKSIDDILEIQNQRLIDMLHHAWQNTDYYKEILEDCGVVNNGKVILSNFESIPFLTKDVLKREGPRLKAKRIPKGISPYRNQTGGSTGEPVEFWQDNYYWDCVIASRLYRFEKLNKWLGEPEMKIWGSERDLFEGTLGISENLKNFVYNREFQQCFNLPEKRILKIISRINHFKPKLIFAYRDGMDTIADYINKYNIKIYSPKAIVIGGATIYPHIVEAIEKAFHSPVISAYGSREVGDAACQCLEQDGLHIAAYSRKIEVIDDDNNNIIEKEGDIVITTLTNYTMPLIRYRIGDRGALTKRTCKCGCELPLLDSVTGRSVEVFVNETGDKIDPIYFIHLIGVVYNLGYIKKYQVIQKSKSLIEIKIIPEEKLEHEKVKSNLYQISAKIRLVMGENCDIRYKFVDDIPLTESGKFVYVQREFKLSE